VLFCRLVSNRWVRFLLAVAAIALASFAAYRVLDDERRLAGDVTSTRAIELSSEVALATVEELKATLHAYVAPGQGLPFWAARAGLLLDRLRGSLLELDKAASAAGGSIAEALDASDRLAAAEQRARDHVRSGQALLAGEVIFNESRDLLEGLRLQIARGRDQIASAASARQTEIRREQMLLIGGAVGVLALVMLLLVPIGPQSPVLSRQPTVDGPQSSPVLAPAAAVEATAPIQDLASLCSEIAAVTESSQLEPLLVRARSVLNARGVIVWLSSPDRLELHSAAASGYDARVVARLGPIHRETSNLTADAFRENMPRTSAATGTTAAALAVPLPSPDGPAGVFSAELAAGMGIDDAKLAAARVIAAQLGALLGSIPAEQPAARRADR
jgi:hypothetical protein